MSSAYSTINNYADLPVYSPDVNFVIQGLQYKQQQYDHNREKLQTYFDQIASIDLAKGEDVQYFEQRLEQVREIANKYMTGDLSRSSVVNSVMRNLNQILDKDVMTAVTSTKILRSEQKAWQQLKEKSPDKYSQTNYDFAMQNASKWLNDGQRGTAYNGGGGVIEYDDYGMRLMKELPDQMKSLNKNWIETAPGSGMFIDQVTMEMVPRSAVESVMRTIIGEKGYRQMQIDAWGRYRNASEDDIKSSFESFHSSALDEANRNIENLKSLLGKTSDEYAANRYKDALGGWLSKKAQLEAGTFDKVKASSGLQGVYTTLHINQFEDGILDAYSDDPHVTKREIDQNDLETKKYNLKLMELATKEEKSKDSKASTETSPFIYAGQHTLGEGEGYKEMKNPLALLQDEELRGVMGMQNLLKEKVGTTLSVSELMGLREQLSPEKLVNSSGRYIVVKAGGREIKFDKNDQRDRDVMVKFYESAYTDIPERKQVREVIQSEFNGIKNTLVESTKNNKDVSWIPSFDLEIVKVGENQVIRKLDPSKGNLYAKLLWNKSQGKTLTDEQEATLDMYIKMHTIADPKIDQELKREMFLDLSGSFVGVQGNSKLPQSVKVIEDAVSNFERSKVAPGEVGLRKTLDHSGGIIPGFVSTAFGAYTSGVIEAKRATSDVYISERGSWDTDVRGKNLSRSVDDFSKNVKTLAENSLKNRYDQPDVAKYNVVPKTDEYAKIATAVGLNVDSKIPITVWQRMENGKLTGEYDWEYSETAWDKDGKEYQKKVSSRSTDKKPISAQAASEVGLQFKVESASPYDIKYGENASPIPLGSSYMDDALQTEYVNRYQALPKLYDRDVVQNLLETASSYGNQEQIATYLADFMSGAINGYVQVYNGEWAVVFKKGDKVIGHTPVENQERFSTSEAASLMFDKNKHVMNEDFYNFLLRKNAEGAATRLVQLNMGR